MRAQEGIVFANNAAAGTYSLPAGVEGVLGGRYLVLFDCTGTPALQAYALTVSGNWVKVGSSFTTAGGGSFEIALPPGQVQFIVSTSTANSLTLSRIPND